MDGGGLRRPRGQQCSALVRWHWHVWHVRTYSATSRSCPTQRARRRTSDPVLARPKCQPSYPYWHLRRTCICRLPPTGVHSRSAAPWPQQYNRQHSTRNVPPGVAPSENQTHYNDTTMTYNENLCLFIVFTHCMLFSCYCMSLVLLLYPLLLILHNYSYRMSLLLLLFSTSLLLY